MGTHYATAARELNVFMYLSFFFSLSLCVEHKAVDHYGVLGRRLCTGPGQHTLTLTHSLTHTHTLTHTGTPPPSSSR